MIVAVFGLGEAGSLFAADLAAAGARVIGFDPAAVETPQGVERVEDPAQAVAGADLVIALTAAADAPQALGQALASIPPRAVYADLSTAAAASKQSLAATAASRGLRFADVALMAIVPGNGVCTPSLASGSGAVAYRDMVTALGGRVDAISTRAGDAATRKLLRSVFMKGLAAVVIEAMTAADAAGQAQWLWGNVVDEITAAGRPMLTRMVEGTGPHAARRLHEMEACRQLLAELGVDPVMTTSTVESLRRVVHDGVPAIPEPDDDVRP
jgi:3-hydroxyisobutyrate dehydrogenase-like beta-hydroxyacid dehydrogenase